MRDKLFRFIDKHRKLLGSTVFILTALILVKIIFQLIIIESGFRWLSADDYCRTVISYDWMTDPKIYAGVWLSLHFWINALFIFLFKDLFLSALLANSIFSVLTLIYFYFLVKKIFNKTIAILSGIVFTIFPFQVWLSSSGLPESIYFFFIIGSCYHFILWYNSLLIKGDEKNTIRNILISAFYLNMANLLRYEGWIFGITFIVLVIGIAHKKFRFSVVFAAYALLSLFSMLSAVWWLYQNQADHGDMFYFAHETTKIFVGLGTPGFWQRLVQYPSFIFYIAPITTIIGIGKLIKVLRNQKNGWEGNFSLIRIFLFFNIGQLLFLMASGLMGSGGTNMISRYVVINSILFIPFGMWQLYDLRKYIAAGAFGAVALLNIIWSFYYPQAYREDTYEVASLTKKLHEINYFEPEDKIYFEHVEGYFDIYPLQVSSNQPHRFISDTIPTYFPPSVPNKKKVSNAKLQEDQQQLNILELRKFLESKRVKLFIARSDYLIDKLNKLSTKSELIGDYRIFYLSRSKLSFRKEGGSAEYNERKFEITPDMVSFDKKLVLKEFRIDNTNLGLNPQTTTFIWTVADNSIFDDIITSDRGYDRYKVRLELCSNDNDSCVYDIESNIFSERIVEEFFETEEIKTILLLKPFAMLNYSLPALKRKPSPFMGGIYNLKLFVIDDEMEKVLPVYRGDSTYIYIPERNESDTVFMDVKAVENRISKHKDRFIKKPYYPLGRIVAIFPDTDYNEMLKRSKDLSEIISRNGFMLLFSQRYTGDHFLNWIFNYF